MHCRWNGPMGPMQRVLSLPHTSKTSSSALHATRRAPVTTSWGSTSRPYSKGHQSPVLSWQEMYRASKLAEWSGWCYFPVSYIESACQAQGLQLLGHGRTQYTSWFVAQGRISHSPLVDQVMRTGSSSSSTNGSSTASTSTTVPGPGSDHALGNHQHLPSNPGATAGQVGTAAPQHTSSSAVQAHAPDASSEECRFIFLRGVQWGAPETSVMDMWMSLMNFWPTPLQAAMKQAPGSPKADSIVSHSGVTSMAGDLLSQVSPFIQDLPKGMPLALAGHSLGGALGMLLFAMAKLQHQQLESSQVTVHTFGSPPVLAHRDGGGGRRVLDALGSHAHACRAFVLEHDPIPRALITSDPYYNALKQYDPVRRVLEAREWLLGPGSFMSMGRFVFENVGEVYFIKGDGELVPVKGGESEALMAMNIREVLDNPLHTLRYWLDHHHSSYASDLYRAAMRQARRQLRQTGVLEGSRPLSGNEGGLSRTLRAGAQQERAR